jgi:hypothetical protein
VILTAADLAGKLAREYLRVSYDKTGKLESPARQHEKNREAAEQLGLRIGDPYAEPEAVSAARWSGKRRVEFERLVADLDGGTFGAQILIIRDSMRGGRGVTDWDRLINACEKARVWILVTSHGRLYDASNARDRRSLQEDAVDAEYDNAKRRDAVLIATAARAAAGEPHGRAPYGYLREYDPFSRRLVRQARNPAEAPVIEELFARLHAGETFGAITADFRKREIKTRRTKAKEPQYFRHTDLLKMAQNAAYAGLRVRTPKGTCRARGDLSGAVEARWPPLVDPEVFHAVQALLADPSRRTSRDGRARHLLGMIARCGTCAGTLTARYRKGIRYYFCRDGGHVQIPADELDVFAGEAIRRFLSRKDALAALMPSPESALELGRVREELDSALANLRSWREKAALGKVSAESWEVIEPPILAGIARLQERERELSVPDELGDWVGSPEEVAARWDGAVLAARRRLARRLLSPRYMGWLAVVRVPDGRGSVPAEWRARFVKAPLPAGGVSPAVTGTAERESAREAARAARAGVTVELYRERVAAGFLFCLLCREFQPRGEFGSGGPQPGGIAASCRKALRERRASREAARGVRPGTT